MDNYIVPVLILALFIYALIKKVPVYDSFVKGAAEALKMCFSIFPYLVAIFLCVEFFRVSGLSAMLAAFLSPIFNLIGIPRELIELMLIRPMSGSAGLTLLSEIYTEYGADSYVARCASLIMATSETVFYVVAVYFSGIKIKNLGLAVFISLFATLISCALGCILLKFM